MLVTATSSHAPKVAPGPPGSQPESTLPLLKPLSPHNKTHTPVFDVCQIHESPTAGCSRARSGGGGSCGGGGGGCSCAATLNPAVLPYRWWKGREGANSDRSSCGKQGHSAHMHMHHEVARAYKQQTKTAKRVQHHMSAAAKCAAATCVSSPLSMLPLGRPVADEGCPLPTLSLQQQEHKPWVEAETQVAARASSQKNSTPALLCTLIRLTTGTIQLARTCQRRPAVPMRPFPGCWALLPRPPHRFDHPSPRCCSAAACAWLPQRRHGRQ